MYSGPMERFINKVSVNSVWETKVTEFENAHTTGLELIADPVSEVVTPSLTDGEGKHVLDL